MELTLINKYTFGIMFSLFVSAIQVSYSQTKSDLDSFNSNTPKYSKAIEDNSFLMEEAYNQEEGVIQHISALIKDHFSNYIYTFTEEWPVFSQAHQLSATIPFSYLNSSSNSGLGDIYLNYRYQLFGHDDWITSAPRFSILLPTGNSEKGLGEDVTGFQVNVPVSKRFSEQLIMHLNLGLTTLPNYKAIIGENEIKKTLTSYNYGISFIWLMNYKFNFMLEYVGNSLAEFDESNTVRHNFVHTLNPGIRYAIDIGDLQIVPGIAVPINFEKDSSNINLLMYLSFEHSL